MVPEPVASLAPLADAVGAAIVETVKEYVPPVETAYVASAAATAVTTAVPAVVGVQLQVATPAVTATDVQAVEMAAAPAEL